MKSLSIGMFDSGVGGLTVLKELRTILPRERILYLGDTARVPYGNRSPYTVTKYSIENALFLLTKGIKILVIACNTSSALSLSMLKRKLPIPVIGVIDAGAREAVSKTKTGRIGVIGTRATIKSMAYEKAINRFNPDAMVLSKSCPLFVPIVEEGLERDGVAYSMAEKYLEMFIDSGVDCLILGCTHYPMLKDVIQKVMGDGVSIINTGEETAKEVRATLVKRGLIKKGGEGRNEYFVTDSPESFKEIGSRFLGEPIEKIKYLKNLDYKNFLLSS